MNNIIRSFSIPTGGWSSYQRTMRKMKIHKNLLIKHSNVNFTKLFFLFLQNQFIDISLTFCKVRVISCVWPKRETNISAENLSHLSFTACTLLCSRRLLSCQMVFHFSLPFSLYVFEFSVFIDFRFFLLNWCSSIKVLVIFLFLL